MPGASASSHNLNFKFKLKLGHNLNRATFKFTVHSLSHLGCSCHCSCHWRRHSTASHAGGATGSGIMIRLVTRPGIRRLGVTGWPASDTQAATQGNNATGTQCNPGERWTLLPG